MNEQYLQVNLIIIPNHHINIYNNKFTKFTTLHTGYSSRPIDNDVKGIQMSIHVCSALWWWSITSVRNKHQSVGFNHQKCHNRQSMKLLEQSLCENHQNVIAGDCHHQGNPARNALNTSYHNESLRGSEWTTCNTDIRIQDTCRVLLFTPSDIDEKRSEV